MEHMEKMTMKAPEKKGSVITKIMKTLLPVLLILAGIGGYRIFSSREVTMKRQAPEKQAAVVEVMALEPKNHQTYVEAMGTVLPDREVTLKSKVAGEVVSVSPDFVLGGLLKKGEILLQIDDSDYRIELKKIESALEKALSDFALEQGQQQIAKEELKLINQASGIEIAQTDLALRKPQLVQAHAAVESARADLEKAKLNLSRTKIMVPFNALVIEKQVNSGSFVSAQGSVAVIVDVDSYQVEALVPPDRIDAIRISETDGSAALIYSQYSNRTWTGRVVRVTGKITSKSRMAGVIISVPDPLGLKKEIPASQLLLDDHVNVRISGQSLENAYAVPRSILRDGNTVWIYKAGRLEIKDVDLVWKEDGQVFIRSGVNPGDQAVTSDLTAPVNGMALQLDSGDRS